MQEEQPVKRSWFTGVVVVLLVASMTYNMFLFSQKLHSDQRERVEAGERIIHAAWDTKLYAETILSQTQTLMASSSLEERIMAKQELSYAFGNSAQGLQDLIVAAQEQEPRDLPSQLRDAFTFMKEVEASLRIIGNHEGQLTGPERAYLAQVESWYTRLLEEITAFDVTRATQQESLLMFTDTEWVDIAYAMVSIMNEPDTSLYEGVEESELETNTDS
ncbi:hypothetical protein [Paenibacillus daejeonensis]|uniref:hypothetical protein n=1 Tax=Paenibacillus daejeonensis TaxID=135193 RepID=UPI00036B1A46|nr:hypothetical protein [Paenibacillus daejeonensis]